MYKFIGCDRAVGTNCQYSRVMLTEYDVIVIVGDTVGYDKISNSQALAVYIRGDRLHIRAEGVVCSIKLGKDFFRRKSLERAIHTLEFIGYSYICFLELVIGAFVALDLDREHEQIFLYRVILIYAAYEFSLHVEKCFFVFICVGIL